MAFHNRIQAPFLGAFLLAVAAFTAKGQGGYTAPLEYKSNEVIHNLQSQRGAPLSNTVGTPAGSDGRAPTTRHLDGAAIPPTTMQWQGLSAYSAVVTPGNPAGLNATRSYAGNSRFIDLPRSPTVGDPQVVLVRASVGATIVAEQVTLLFGSNITPPEVDESGDLLEETIDPTVYWLTEPYTTNNHDGADYYWSPHAKKTFATKSGPVDIVWQKREPLTEEPADFGTNPENYHRDGDFYFPLFRQRLLVSGVAVKAPRRMYWTEGVFQNTGITIGVPSGRVGTVNFVYNTLFPKRVENEYVATGQSFVVEEGRLEEKRTIWFDQSLGLIKAYNHEGRIFMELLGDTTTDSSTREHLGFEVVDVRQQARPFSINIDIGDIVTAHQDGRDDTHLTPRPVNTGSFEQFYFSHTPPGTDRPNLYATRRTFNLNDVLVYWTIDGEQGLQWPERFTRYNFQWPVEIAKYSHYVRPPVTSESEAELTSVELPVENGPTIVYQDEFDRPRAKLTETFRFYTHLTSRYPAHRTLLRYTTDELVVFERVYSWLNTNLKFIDDTESQSFDETVATALTAWNDETNVLEFDDDLVSPRYIEQNVVVGQRIAPPTGELGAVGSSVSYLAGHIHLPTGNSYDPTAYIDPLTDADGFETANLSSIIPVNAIPNANKLEVWWFRQNDIDVETGIARTYWPSAVGVYTIGWPTSPDEIILASNDGSGGLPSYQARGSLYVQNDPTAIGYNPNEEHGLILGGQIFALRDDLNITTESGYSSEPYALLRFTGTDGRPSIRPFKVLREKPSEGIVFDYIVEAGKQLQAPMPLPLLPKPLEITGINVKNYNTEPSIPNGETGDEPANFDDGRRGGLYSHYDQFTYQDRKNEFWVYRGAHAGLPTLAMGTYNTGTDTFDAFTGATVKTEETLDYHVHTSRRPDSLRLEALDSNPLPGWLSINGLLLTGSPGEDDEGSVTIDLKLTDVGLGDSVTASLDITVGADATTSGQAVLQITSPTPTSGQDVTFVGRPPYLAEEADYGNSFRMQFYYKNMEGFAWPAMTAPQVDTVVPYLRPLDAQGDVDTSISATSKTDSLEIIYRPTWPPEPPQLRFADTLMTAKNGLPAVRGQSSMQLLYQQSIAQNFPTNNTETPKRSVALHDATREKSVDIADQSLDALPPSAATSLFQGLTYFPNLPAHLADRFFFDPNRSETGHLVFKGEFKEEIFGDDYLMLNVAHGNDRQALKDIVPSSDTENKTAWDSLINALQTTVETFTEDPDVPGTYIPDGDPSTVGIGELAIIEDSDTAVDSYSLSATGPGDGYVSFIVANGEAFTDEGDPITVYVIRVTDPLALGELKVITAPNPLSELVTIQHSLDVGARYDQFEYDWMIGPPVDGQPPVVDDDLTGWAPFQSGTDLPFVTLGGSGIQTLIDNYFIMRFRPKNQEHPLYNQWSDWTSPQLVEGWIKRVLAGINPFNQRITDLFNNAISTDVSLLTQAGQRWEGDIALNLDNINDFGLIEIYETVLNRGKNLSIDANPGINFGPANDALLLAAGYINDLYMAVGNEAEADAANPTIGIGTDDGELGDVATSLFAFKGQEASLLDEELALLRGRDDFRVPGVELSPVYNRLVWNYTRGIDSGEVIYALNYNIKENPNDDPDGLINAADAAVDFPQGHGDAYGHFLTALKGYYGLLLDTDFTWIPRIEAVSLLGQPVSVDYQDERKFAKSAAAVAKMGQQVFDLTWRKDYDPDSFAGWDDFGTTRTNTNRTVDSTRYWGMDHWATRTGQGAYLNWIVGNAILPDEDPDPTHEGIQKVDRTTVPELQELPITYEALQTSMDNAEGRLNPLGFPENSVPFDLNPQDLTTVEPTTHFEQIFQRAQATLNNALIAFDDAKNVTRLLRSEQDSLDDLQADIAEQESEFESALVALYGTPYPDDIGPGKTYSTGYGGPDLLHYTYVDLPESDFDGFVDLTEEQEFDIEITDFPDNWGSVAETDFFRGLPDEENGPTYATINIGTHGFFSKPSAWTGVRRSPGEIQQAISEVIRAHGALAQVLGDANEASGNLDYAIILFNAANDIEDELRKLEKDLLISEQTLATMELAFAIKDFLLEATEDSLEDLGQAAIEGIPSNLIAGLAAGGDLGSAARAAIKGSTAGVKTVFNWEGLANLVLLDGFGFGVDTAARWTEFNSMAPLESKAETIEAVGELADALAEIQSFTVPINQAFRDYDDALRAYRAIIAEGDSIQADREVFRRRASALVQGFRTRDAGFRIFRDEKLERYKSLFDLAARYAYFAAKAFDYETGLLGTSAGQDFVSRIVSSRALGIVEQGEPQFAGSDAGDPGISSALAEMWADWQVLKPRLGFNNPDEYTTTISLRTEKERIFPDSSGDNNWVDLIENDWHSDDLRLDADVMRYCMQIENGQGLPVPGLVIPFSTVIADGLNIFGETLLPGDHAFSPTSFATKIYAAGIALEGYQGMDDPVANGSTVAIGGGVSPAAPTISPFDPNALAATPYVYLIPVGTDSMRSPPLGDQSVIRTWKIDDVTIPMPFNIGSSQFSSKNLFQAGDSLSDDLFSIRKHQAFRPVASANAFTRNIYGGSGGLTPSSYTSSRLIGRSVWNSRWKLVIPYRSMHNNTTEARNRFKRTVKDIKLHFVTYSYSGN